MHGETRTVLSAKNITITEQDGVYSLGPLTEPYLQGRPDIVERLEKFLTVVVKDLNG
jgi:hypothetical protein